MVYDILYNITETLNLIIKFQRRSEAFPRVTTRIRTNNNKFSISYFILLEEKTFMNEFTLLFLFYRSIRNVPMSFVRILF